MWVKAVQMKDESIFLFFIYFFLEREMAEPPG